MRRVAKPSSSRRAACLGLTVCGLFLAWLVGGASAALAVCGNEAFRVEQHATGLPECRAYEMVSPLEKGGVDVLGEAQRPFNKASESGSSLVFGSVAAFADPEGGANPSLYRAVRGATGWSTVAASPAVTATLQHGPGITSEVDFVSDDTSAEIVRTNARLTPDATPGSYNLYRKNLDTGTYHLLTPGGAVGEGGSSWPTLISATPDLSTVLFESSHRYTADAPEGFEPKMYVSRNGAIELVSVLPGEVPSAGTINSGFVSIGGAIGNGFGNGTGAISDDGRRVFFSVAEFGIGRGLFVRDLATRSTTEILPTDQSPWFEAAARDGSAVLYSNESRLFLYSVGTGTVEEPLPGEPMTVQSVLAVSPDLSTVYFDALGSIVAGQPPIPAGGTAIYRWRPKSDEFKWIANLTAGTGFNNRLTEPGGVFNNLSYRNEVAISADGSSFAFSTGAEVEVAAGLVYDNSSSWLACSPAREVPVEPVRACREVYVYDGAADSVQCASCPLGEPTAMAGLAGDTTVRNGINTSNQHAFAQPRAMSADGSKVFFETGDQLVAADTNGSDDVYMWQRGGGRSLLSNGTSEYNARLLEASTNGDDVFIVTRAQLVRRDTDEVADVYDVRVGGGFAEPAIGVPPCSGEFCRGSAPPSSQSSTPASSVLNGPGNRQQAAKKHRRHRKHHKKHHKKKHHKGKNQKKKHRKGSAKKQAGSKSKSKSGRSAELGRGR